MASVLVIEDEQPLTRIIAWALIEADYEVAAVADVAGAIDKLGRWKPDVIVFNTVIADDVKARALEELRKLAPDVLVVDVSEEKNIRARGLITKSIDGVQADAKLSMPVPTDELVAAVHDVLAKALRPSAGTS